MIISRVLLNDILSYSLHRLVLANMLYKITALVFSLLTFSTAAADTREFCFETKCWEYEEVENVTVGGMLVPDGKYVRADVLSKSVEGEKTKSNRMAEMVFAGDIVDVDIFSFDEIPFGNKSAFSFRYDRSTNSLVEGNTEVRDAEGEAKTRIENSIPEIADDLLKPHGRLSTGESIRLSKPISIRGDTLEVEYVMTMLGKIRYQGENFILLSSNYQFALASVTGKAEGYLMQDEKTSMPRHTAHNITMSVGEQTINMKSNGYVNILAR